MLIEIPEGKSEEQPLLMQYPRECGPQPAHLRILPEDGRAHWDWYAEIGSSVPMTVWHHREYWVPVPADLTIEEIAELSARMEPLVARVVAGYTCEWDGRNMVGALTDDAVEALEGLEAALYR